MNGNKLIAMTTSSSPVMSLNCTMSMSHSNDANAEMLADSHELPIADGLTMDDEPQPRVRHRDRELDDIAGFERRQLIDGQRNGVDFELHGEFEFADPGGFVGCDDAEAGTCLVYFFRHGKLLGDDERSNVDLYCCVKAHVSSRAPCRHGTQGFGGARARREQCRVEVWKEAS
ncbi:hypothetical protein X949_4920 [Burkholderia pseudomallei MSHR5609]|nr:hypothetical protein X949_4920 [Burkholderia pseudomallei MSHR5609]